jgi:transposase InsO family protein
MRAADKFHDPTYRTNEMWQIDFTYLKIIGWGWYYLSTILDDYSRYIIAWELCSTMKVTDVKVTLDMALDTASIKTGCKPKLLSDNGLYRDMSDPLEGQHARNKWVSMSGMGGSACPEWWYSITGISSLRNQGVNTPAFNIIKTHHNQLEPLQEDWPSQMIPGN